MRDIFFGGLEASVAWTSSTKAYGKCNAICDKKTWIQNLPNHGRYTHAFVPNLIFDQCSKCKTLLVRIWIVVYRFPLSKIMYCILIRKIYAWYKLVYVFVRSANSELTHKSAEQFIWALQLDWRISSSLLRRFSPPQHNLIGSCPQLCSKIVSVTAFFSAWDLDKWLECLTAMHQLQVSWVRSQHPSAQWNLRGGRWSSVELVRKKYKKIPPKNIKKKK